MKRHPVLPGLFGQGAFFLHDILAILGLGVDTLLHRIQRCLPRLRRKGGEYFQDFGNLTRRYAEALVGIVIDLAGVAALLIARLQRHLSGAFF